MAKIKFNAKRFNQLVQKTIEDANKDFIQRLQIEKIVKKIYDLILAGITPVGNIPRKFQAYSKSYRSYLKGDVSFITIKGKVIPITPSVDGKITWKNPSKVNLFFYGDMLNSLYSKISGNVLKIGFSDKKAVYHNGSDSVKPRVERRLLPTRKGETWTPTIDTMIKRTGKKAIVKAFEKNKQLNKIVIKLKTKT